MGALFCYLAVDDLLSLHERFGALLQPWFGGCGVYVWVFTLGPVFAVLGMLCAAKLLRVLAAEPIRRACLLLGFAALGIAFGFEVIEDMVVRSAWQPRGIPLINYTQWIEESLELLGPVFLLAAAWPPPMPGSVVADQG